jgi:hypothetical protein
LFVNSNIQYSGEKMPNPDGSKTKEELHEAIEIEAKRIREMLKDCSKIGIMNMKALTGSIPQKRCKACGDYIDNSYKSRLCAQCHFKFKNARLKKRGY